MEKPKLIVITPVRNEAWVLDAFLTHCSSWADYIIIADHHSTDGSRDIARMYEKVILIDNPCEEWVENECRARLLEEALKIGGDKIIFALDADEFLSEGFERTAGWQEIIHSKPNVIFCFSWLNLFDDFYTYANDRNRSEWVAHFSSDIDIVSEYRTRESNAVHCQRVPCLDDDVCRYVDIEDIKFVHLAKLNHRRTRNKLDFYQVVNIDKNPVKSSAISMYRSYNKYYSHDLKRSENAIALCCANSTLTCNGLVRTSDFGQHYIEEIIAILKRKGSKQFEKLCVWDNQDLRDNGVDVKPVWTIRIVHWYMKATQPYSRNWMVHVIDAFLKRIY